MTYVMLLTFPIKPKVFTSQLRPTERGRGGVFHGLTVEVMGGLWAHSIPLQKTYKCDLLYSHCFSYPQKGFVGVELILTTSLILGGQAPLGRLGPPRGSFPPPGHLPLLRLLTHPSKRVHIQSDLGCHGFTRSATEGP